MKTAFTGEMAPRSHYPLPEDQVVLCSGHIPQVPTPLPIPQQQGKGNRFVSVTESASADSNVHERRVVGPTVTLSSVGSEPLVNKRKLREYEQCGNKEDAKFKVEATKKQVDISAAPRRPRAAAHYLSERRRRCKINERMKALQELIPQSNKSVMVSLLDGTVEYLKLLQNQVQMMSSGYSIVANGMGMGMQPYLVKPPYHPPSSSNQSDPSLGHFGLQNPHPMQMHFTDLYHHYNLQAPPHQPQVHTVVQPSTSKGANRRHMIQFIPSPEARRNLMKLTQRMIRTFCFNISTSGGQSWTSISDSAQDTIRITTRKNNVGY